jgi:lipopolysaccharide heptosyltransferase II
METGLIGELLVITPVLRAIGKAYPEADVTVVVRPGSAPVLVGNPYVKKLLPLVGKERRGVLGVMRLASWVRSRNFDAALVLHTSFRSALITLMGAVPVRAGTTDEGRGFLLTHKKQRDKAAYEVDEHLAVLELIGIPPDGRETEMFLTDEERSRANRLLDQALGHASDSTGWPRPLVGLHPGASRQNRRWPLRHFVELAGRLEREANATPVFFFGPREEDLAHAVTELRERDGKAVPAMVRPGNIRELAAAFESMDVVVTNNTGPMHVAAAMRTPGVFINGPTPVERWHPPGPLTTPVFAEDVTCRPCDLPRCKLDRLACLEDLSADSVLRAVQHYLNQEAEVEAHTA